MKKPIVKFTCALLIAALLTFSVGKAQRVSAMEAVSAAAIAAAALVVTGMVVYTYIVSTGARYELPSAANDRLEVIKNIGNKALYYTSGLGIYNEVRSLMTRRNNTDITGIFRYTADMAKSLYNDFKSIPLIQSLFGIELETSTGIPTNGYDYPSTTISFVDGINLDIPNMATSSTFIPHATLAWANGYYAYISLNFSNEIFNIAKLQNNGTYIYSIGYTVNNRYYDIPAQNFTLYWGDTVYYYAGHYYYPVLRGAGANAREKNYEYGASNTEVLQYTGTSFVPVLPATKIVYLDNNVVIDTKEVTTETGLTRYEPVWNNNDDDDNHNAIIPYVPLPSGDTIDLTPSSWGLSLDELSDMLIDAGEEIIDWAMIAELIDSLKSTQLSDDDSYSYVDNYTYYYYNTYDNGTYPVYNINISQNEDEMPVDLNQIKEYTSNRYMSTLKDDGQQIGSIVAKTLSVVHNIDYELLYILLGGAIFTLVCALIGKAGK